MAILLLFDNLYGRLWVSDVDGTFAIENTDGQIVTLNGAAAEAIAERIIVRRRLEDAERAIQEISAASDTTSLIDKLSRDALRQQTSEELSVRLSRINERRAVVALPPLTEDDA